MSEYNDKITAFSGRQPAKRRQRRRQVEKLEPNKSQVQSIAPRTPKEGTKLVRVKNSANSAATPTGVLRTRPGAVVPPNTKPKSSQPRVSAIKPMNTVKGKIPPFKPNSEKLKTVPKQVISKTTKRKRTSQKPQSKTRLKPMAKSLLYGLRLLIVGVGIGAIVGTVLSVLDPATRMNIAGAESNSTVEQKEAQPSPNNTPVAANSGLYLSQEITSLKNAVQSMAANNPNLTPGIFLVDLDSGAYVDVNAGASFPAASTIKMPILAAFFQDVDAGKVRLDEMLTMQQDMVAGGSGNMQFNKAGTQYTALEVATKMITISDNTATNMLISRLGGMEALNQRFRSWGLTTTQIHNLLPDLPGTNTTSPKELGNLMGMVNQGNLVSTRSRDRMLDIMRRTQKDTLLPSGLGPGTTIAHKTGDIGTMLADAGLVDLPTGKRYIAAVMVQRPNNDSRAEKLISSISRAAYQQFSQNAVTPSPTPTTAPPPTYQPPVVSPRMGTTAPPPTYQPPVVSPRMGTTAPLPTYQPPVMSPVMPNNTGIPIYQPPVMSPVPNGMGTNIPPMTGYQSPVMSPVMPYPMGTNVPPIGYQPPVMNPQYYPPQR